VVFRGLGCGLSLFWGGLRAYRFGLVVCGCARRSCVRGSRPWFLPGWSVVLPSGVRLCLCGLVFDFFVGLVFTSLLSTPSSSYDTRSVRGYTIHTLSLSQRYSPD
jgi:hypothetical protein